MIRKILQITGIEDKIRKEERVAVGKELHDLATWMYGGEGDMVRGRNPQLPFALNKTASMVMTMKPINPSWLRDGIVEKIKEVG